MDDNLKQLFKKANDAKDSLTDFKYQEDTIDVRIPTELTTQNLRILVSE